MGAIPLHAGQFHLWFGFYDELETALSGESSHSIMSDAERGRQRDLARERDRTRFGTTRVLVRHVLSRYVDLSPGQWEFESDAFGRPRIANAVDGAGDLEFNLSHTERAVAMIVTRQARTGVDLESTCRTTPSLDIAERFFLPEEARELRALPAEVRHERFVEYWTLKEAYVKARGEGLVIPLDQFGFSLARPGTIRAWIDPMQRDTVSRWHFFQYWISAADVLSICLEAPGVARPNVVIRLLDRSCIGQPIDIAPHRVSIVPDSDTLHSFADDGAQARQTS